jgi:uncharacterized protein (DUF4213/DUF364 family)
MNPSYLSLGLRLWNYLGRPRVNGVYLPEPVPDETFRDEFGFVFLEDGSVGPFYVSMGDLLQNLWSRYPEPMRHNGDAREFLQGFSRGEPAGRALALGTFNALSAAVMLRSEYVPPDRASQSGLDGIRERGCVGMVGYFCPLVDKLVAQGRTVVILERAPERADGRDDVVVTTEPGDLGDCPVVLCTASTLINDSLDGLLEVLGSNTSLELIGPSGSGLPDPLFARGVASVGGVLFGDRARLLEALRRGESWGTAGRKYQLTPASYPGSDRLLGSGR